MGSPIHGEHHFDAGKSAGDDKIEKPDHPPFRPGRGVIFAKCRELFWPRFVGWPERRDGAGRPAEGSTRQIPFELEGGER
jgi:hypothetical protein